jgi:GDPmannose 4,6-dehydratase
MSRTALVTGIYGQDGSLLAEHLLARGYRVVGVARPDAPPRNETACDVIAIDLAHPPARWAHDLLGRVAPDEIYCLAACHRSSDPNLRDDPDQQQRMVDVNFAAPLALAHAVLAARSSTSLVLAASSQMYTPTDPPLRVDEQTPFSPTTFYGTLKASAVSAIRFLRDQQGLRGASAILFNHESPRRTPDFVSRRISRAAARIAAGLERELEVVDLASLVDFSSARDVVAGLHVMAATATPVDCVVASGQLHSIEDICRVAFSAVGLDYRDYVRSQRPPGPRSALVGDPSRLSSLGWSATRSFEDWVREMVARDVP